MLIGKHKRQRIITGLDIGTTKVCVIIGQADDEDNLTILGMGSCPSHGLQRGEITGIQPTIDAVNAAADQAMKTANVPIGDVYAGIAGEHIRSQNNEAMVEIRHPARGIDEKDRRRVVQKAADIVIPEDQALLHRVVQDFRVNNGSRTHNPIGLCGSTLEVRTHLVTANVDSLSNIIRCVRRAGMRHPTVVLQSLASSMSVATPQEIELGCLLIDIGGGTTDVSISVDGAIRATAEISLGGDRVTRDIAEVLACSISDAENIKKRFGCALPEMVERGKTFQTRALGDADGLETHEERLLAQIIEARLEDVFKFVREFVDESGFAGRLHAGAVLTGGTALLNGITDVAGRVLDMKCRLGIPRGLKGFAQVVKSPIYSTGVGLILYGLQDEREAANRHRGRVGRLFDYVLENFM